MKTPEGSVFRQIGSAEKDQKIQPKFRSPYIDRFPAEKIHRKIEGQPNIAANVSADIANSMTTGAPLPLSVRRFMEPRFNANFSDVKVHTGDKSAKLNRQLNARAFTVGNQIFFGKNQFQPEHPEGKELIAHELTHTIQQGAAIQRSEDVSVTRQAPVQVQRLGLSDALDYFADKANLIPGFRMFTIILGVNPINMSSVDRSAANILRALVEFLPGGGLIVQALDNHGVFEKVGKWVEQQIKTLGLVGSSIKQAITAFLDSLSWKDIFDLGGVWNRAKSIFTEPIDRIISFAKGLVTGILKFIKEAIVRPLAKLAEGTAGYDLLKVVLGEDPVTGDPVPFNPDLLIGGFMKLIGQEEIWNNLKKANGVARATAWFKGAIASVVSFVRQIPGLFIAALQALEIADIILVPRAFGKLVKVFGGFVSQFARWAGNAVWNLLEIIFDVVSPGAFAHVKRTGAALRSILKNPLPFVGNLVKAAKLGFLNFADNIGTHLKAGLLDWLLGAMPGVYIPKSFSLVEIAKFALSVLGLTWANIRAKLVKVVGETAVKAMETGFDIVVALVTQGPAAAWDKIKEQLGNLKDMVIGGITDFVVDMVVKKAIPKLVAMFIPGAGFISAILSIYDTVMVFVQKLSKIAAVVSGFIASIVSIAQGVIGAAAKRVESTLAGLLSLAISFLAGFAGLGNVAAKILGVFEKVRAPFGKAIDWLVNWIVTTAKKLFAKFFGKKDKPEERTQEQKKVDLAKGIAEARTLLDDKKLSAEQVKKKLPAIKSKYKITIFELVTDAKSETKETSHVHGEIHSIPVKDDSSKVEKEADQGSVTIAVISTKTPRASSIPTVPKQKTAQTSPAHFELDTTKAIAGVTGLPVEPNAKFTAKEKGGIVTFEAPDGFTASPSGLLLPSTPRLFGTLSGDPKQRDKEEPRVEVKGGDLRLRGLKRHPDALLITPDQIEPLEFTLDATMSMKETKSAESHKIMQIPGTIENLLRNFPRTTPVVYTVFVRGAVPQQRIDELQRALKGITGNIDVTINFVRR
ncbi:DUF4157 domain-containing protein [Pannus brasiliensis CCIBt3594]|uniref:DUF4157 domain-containing protein n=1 Tax=Pannus brasiliensis CCIBt3594 TaxID=1427578 RepID=A0AAW9QQW5_9CHRO